MIRKALPHMVFLLLLLVSLTACGDSGAKEEKSRAERPPVAVEVSQVAAAELKDTVDVVGSLAPKFCADIKSELDAVVAEVYVTEWVEVKKGTPLAKLDVREEEATLDALKASVLQAEVAETRALRERERALKLKEHGLITQQHLDDTLTAKEAAEAATKAAEAQLKAAETKLSKSLIRAPMDGVISYRGVSVGSRVERMGSGDPMFCIVQNRILDLSVSVPSVKMTSVKVGQPIVFSVDSFPDKEFTGNVMFINPALDTQNRTVKLVAEVNNEKGLLRGGLFVKGKIITGIRKGVLLIPRSALLNWDLSKHSAEVFVVKGDQGEVRRVQTGVTSGDYVEISSGLVTGDLVVTRGAFNIRSGDRIRVTSQGA
jgi:membrane fusion protein (multidrug efflux system)